MNKWLEDLGDEPHKNSFFEHLLRGVSGLKGHLLAPVSPIEIPTKTFKTKNNMENKT